MADEKHSLLLDNAGAIVGKVTPMCTQRRHCAIRASERIEGRRSAGAVLKSRARGQEFKHGANGLR